MKKFVKGSLIVAGILAALGCVFCIISILAGGRSVVYWIQNDEYAEEKLEYAEEKLEYALSKIHIGNRHSVVRDYKRAESLEKIKAEEVRNLDLTLGAGTFTIRKKEVSDGSIDIRIEGTDRWNSYVKNGTLYVEGFTGVKVIDKGISKNAVTLEIPADMSFDEVDMEIGAGIVEVYDLKARNADISVGMGECIYRGTIQENLDAECNMGNMEFDLSGSETEYNYELECAAGNIYIGDSSFSALAMEKKIYNGARGTFEISCNMGDIRISFE